MDLLDTALREAYDDWGMETPAADALRDSLMRIRAMVEAAEVMEESTTEHGESPPAGGTWGRFVKALYALQPDDRTLLKMEGS